MSIADSSPLTWPYAAEEPPLEGPYAELEREARADWEAFCQWEEEDLFAEDAGTYEPRPDLIARWAEPTPF